MELPISSHVLDNGLRLIVCPNHDLPVVAVAVAYQVGSVDEERGKSGFAHLFEHLMFQGSEHVPRNGHFKLVEAAGGTLNAFTTKERTIYYEALPSNQLELALWLESERMRSLRITQESLDMERSTVKEERRQSYDNRPYGRAYELLEELASSDPAYGHSVIGSMEDLDRASLEDVRAFFAAFYTPRNALLVMAGDVEPRRALVLARRYFGGITGAKPPRRRVARTRATGERRRSITDPLAEVPALLVALPSPSSSSRAGYAARYAAEMLSGGESSRLYRRLVKGDAVALEVNGHLERHAGPSLLMLSLLTRAGRTHAAEVAVREELRRMALEAPAADEIDKARNKLLAAHVNGLSSSIGRAVEIATEAMLAGAPDAVNGERRRLEQVTGRDVRQAARAMSGAARAWVTVAPRAGSA